MRAKPAQSGPWVTIFQSLSLIQLQVAQSLLGSHGIKAIMPDENMARFTSSFIAGMGRLQVRESEARKAKEILDKLAP